MRTLKLGDLRTNEQVLADQMANPEFRAEWERTSIARSLALQVLTYRTEHHLSQKAMADLLGMRQPQVARIEAACHNPEIETLSRVADVVGIEIQVTIPTQRREPTFRAKPRRRHQTRRDSTINLVFSERKAATG